MIRIQSLHIEHFRGIHDLTLEPGGRNFAVCGPNGSGKSGVVDALEFAITGSISRLVGEGTSSVSVKSHASHVDNRKTPELARVLLTAFIPSLNKTVSIERCVDSPHEPTIIPADSDVLSLVKELEGHPEFALSRREIIKYVLATPGDRSKEIQALLRLDRIEKIRQSLQTILNSLRTEAKKIEQDVNQAQVQLVRALDIKSLGAEQIVEAVNTKRNVLGLEPLKKLLPETSLKEGIATPSEQGKPRQRVAKKQALTDLDELSKFLNSPETKQVSESRTKTAEIVRKLLESPSLLRSLHKQDFLQSGLELLDLDSCPFCGTKWDIEELRQFVQRGLDEAIQATSLKRGIENAALALASSVRQIEALTNTIAGYGRVLMAEADAVVLEHWASSLKRRREQISKLENLEEVLRDLSSDYRYQPESFLKSLGQIRQSVESLPDPSKEDEAREYLTVCQERLEVYRNGKRMQTQNRTSAELAGKVLDAYNSTVTEVLDKIYENVATDFALYYRFLNQEDESSFCGKLTPGAGKLTLDVDFYGRGFFPPGAYHSEGHQDAMGLCLYLALMKHTLEQRFCFAVLDDVLMSVDSGHRRNVCALLKTHFPETQFLITTHDEIWLRHMVAEQLISSKAFVHFRKWTIDDGPLVWNGKDVWKEIDEALDKGAVPPAAGALRRYLEYMSTYLAERLRAKVEFRGDARYDLGEVLPPVVQTWAGLLKQAKEAANSWNKKDELSRLGKLHEEFTQRALQSEVEQWIINKNVHHNAWETFRKQDFIPVVEAYKSLLESFCCPSCLGYVYALPAKGTREEIRCDCGALTINLKKKT